MGNLCRKQEISFSKGTLSENRKERYFNAISKSSDTPIPSMKSSHSKELTINEMDKILVSGYFSRMHEIDECAAAVNSEDERDRTDFTEIPKSSDTPNLSKASSIIKELGNNEKTEVIISGDFSRMHDIDEYVTAVNSEDERDRTDFTKIPKSSDTPYLPKASSIIKELANNEKTEVLVSGNFSRMHDIDDYVAAVNSEDERDRTDFTEIPKSSDTPYLSKASSIIKELADNGKTEVLITGDFSRMHDIDEYVAAVNSEDERERNGRSICISFRWCYRNSDCATLQALTNLPHFYMFASFIIDSISCDYMINDDPVFITKLRDALLPHIELNHERMLRLRLSKAIMESYPMLFLECVDALWSKAVTDESNDLQNIKDLHRDILKSRNKDITNASVIKTIINSGISRHIGIIFDLINDSSHTDKLNI